MSSTTIYVGIDNGITGGIAGLSITPGAGILALCPMLIQKTRKGTEIDVRGVWRFLLGEMVFGHNINEIAVVIEEPGGSQSASAAASMAASFAALRALCELKGLRYHRVTPQQWQKPMLNCAKGETKAAALTKARSLWPNQQWLA